MGQIVYILRSTGEMDKLDVLFKRADATANKFRFQIILNGFHVVIGCCFVRLDDSGLSFIEVNDQFFKEVVFLIPKRREFLYFLLARQELKPANLDIHPVVN